MCLPSHLAAPQVPRRTPGPHRAPSRLSHRLPGQQARRPLSLLPGILLRAEYATPSPVELPFALACLLSRLRCLAPCIGTDYSTFSAEGGDGVGDVPVGWNYKGKCRALLITGATGSGKHAAAVELPLLPARGAAVPLMQATDMSFTHTYTQLSLSLAQQRQLEQKYPNHFGVVVSHTTRMKREGEKDGADYVFTDREVMSIAIQAGEFLCVTEIDGELYGVKKERIKTVTCGSPAPPQAMRCPASLRTGVPGRIHVLVPAHHRLWSCCGSAGVYQQRSSVQHQPLDRLDVFAFHCAWEDVAALVFLAPDAFFLLRGSQRVAE